MKLYLKGNNGLKQPIDFTRQLYNTFSKKEKDGTWSHKPGASGIQYTDSAGNIIYDPQERAYDKYEYFVGYYEVGPN